MSERPAGNSPRGAPPGSDVLSKILLAAALVLLLVKFGFRARLRELFRRLDWAVNVLLVLIALTYSAQMLYIYFKR